MSSCPLPSRTRDVESDSSGSSDKESARTWQEREVELLPGRTRQEDSRERDHVHPSAVIEIPLPINRRSSRIITPERRDTGLAPARVESEPQPVRRRSCAWSLCEAMCRRHRQTSARAKDLFRRRGRS